MASSSTSLAESPAVRFSRRPAKAATPRMPWRVADGGDGRDPGQVQALGGEQVEGGELGEQHAGQAERGADRVGPLRGGVLVEPDLRLERARERGGELAGDGRDPAGGLLDECASREVSASSPTSSRRVANQSAPWPPKVTANSSPSASRSARERPCSGVAWSWVSVVGGS